MVFAAVARRAVSRGYHSTAVVTAGQKWRTEYVIDILIEIR
jgi:hypothetical protein